MIEFTNFLTACLQQYNACQPCINNCPHNHYCTTNGCGLSNCGSCLNMIQRAYAPAFTYTCKKITYHYVLRFFNRFASEIASAIWGINFGNATKMNVISLGCGPGSEVYGIIKALRERNLAITLNYQGYDLNNVWDDVLGLSRAALAQTRHHIAFFRQDLFLNFVGFPGENVDLLILNYLLSDVEKFASKTDKSQIKTFVGNLAWFVLVNNVKNILFNDNSYYGHDDHLDSGVQLMLLLIEDLKAWGLNLSEFYYFFPGDPYRGNQPWRPYATNHLLFQPLADNPVSQNINECRSKQIFVHIN